MNWTRSPCEPLFGGKWCELQTLSKVIKVAQLGVNYTCIRGLQVPYYVGCVLNARIFIRSIYSMPRVSSINEDVF